MLRTGAWARRWMALSATQSDRESGCMHGGSTTPSRTHDVSSRAKSSWERIDRRTSALAVQSAERTAAESVLQSALHTKRIGPKQSTVPAGTRILSGELYCGSAHRERRARERRRSVASGSWACALCVPVCVGVCVCARV